MTVWKLSPIVSGQFVHARIFADDAFVGHVTVEREEYNDLAERLTTDHAASALAEFQRGWREGATWRNEVHAEGVAPPADAGGQP